MTKEDMILNQLRKLNKVASDILFELKISRRKLEMSNEEKKKEENVPLIGSSGPIAPDEPIQSEK